MNARNIIFIDVGPDLPRHIFFHPAAHLLVPLGGVRRLLPDPLGILVNQGSQKVRNGVNIRL